jgi:hypothetical protein
VPHQIPCPKCTKTGFVRRERIISGRTSIDAFFCGYYRVNEDLQPMSLFVLQLARRMAFTLDIRWSGAAILIVALAMSPLRAAQSSSGASAGATSGPASSLVGLSQAQVRSLLGPASGVESYAWYFDSPVGTLTVFFKNGVVSAVEPIDFEKGVLAAKTAAERAAFVDAVRAKEKAEEERRKAEVDLAREKADADKKKADADAEAARVKVQAELVAFREKAAAEAAAAKAKANADALAARAKADTERRRRESAPFVRLTNSEAQLAITDAAASARNSVDAFDAAFLQRVTRLNPDFRGPQAVAQSDALTILISGPLGLFYSEARERIRKFEPLTPAPAWRPEVHIVVNPTQIDAPDIEKIIVQRNGVVVPPLRVALTPREMVTHMGAKSMIHSGEVMYPLSAFEPGAGASVTVIAIPASGSNIVRTFGPLDLRAIQ